MFDDVDGIKEFVCFFALSFKIYFNRSRVQTVLRATIFHNEIIFTESIFYILVLKYKVSK